MIADDINCSGVIEFIDTTDKLKENARKNFHYKKIREPSSIDSDASKESLKYLKEYDANGWVEEVFMIVHNILCVSIG